jgi:hypothetical protein
MAPPPDQPEILTRLDALGRHIAYLDRRFDDTNARLASGERRVTDAVDGVGDHIGTALARSSRRHALVACALAGQSVALLALAGAAAWP